MRWRFINCGAHSRPCVSVRSEVIRTAQCIISLCTSDSVCRFDGVPYLSTASEDIDIISVCLCVLQLLASSQCCVWGVLLCVFMSWLSVTFECYSWLFHVSVTATDYSMWVLQLMVSSGCCTRVTQLCVSFECYPRLLHVSVSSGCCSRMTQLCVLFKCSPLNVAHECIIGLLHVTVSFEYYSRCDSMLFSRLHAYNYNYHQVVRRQLFFTK